MARWYGRHQHIQAGEYQLTPKMTQHDVLLKLMSGDVVIRKVTIPEGLTVVEIKAIIQQAGGLKGPISITPNEGSLLPDTYHYRYGDTRESIIRRMEKRMRDELARLWKKRQSLLPLRSPEEAVILASIVEKETGVAEERGRVAAVFINRLRRNMRLQSDPTVIYAVTLGKRPFDRSITRRDLATQSPYNTYKVLINSC